MRVPDVLTALADQGVIDEVVRPLQSGKEAQVYLVRSDGEPRVAKVYKDAQHRSFKQRSQYIEGRRVRNTRDQRAMAGRTRHGKAQEEAAWKSAEGHVIYRLHAQGVRVPIPYNFIDGVLIMELVRGEDGLPAPRLSELALEAEAARSVFDQLLREVVKMLCAGIVHGDLSDYNVLLDEAGPVIIDFPQSVDAAQNRNAKKLLVRDVDNLSAFLTRCVPSARRRPYGQEIWAAYEKNHLSPEMELTGQFRSSAKSANVSALLDEIGDAEKDERRRREASGEAAPRARRREVVIAPARGAKDSGGGRGRKRGPRAAPGRKAQGRGSQGRGSEARGSEARGSGGRGSEARGSGGRGSEARVTADGRGASAASGDGEAPRRRRRRRRGGAAKGNGSGQAQQRSEAGSGQANARSSGARSPKARSPNGPGAGAQDSRTPSPRPDAAPDAPKRKRRRRRRRKGPDAGAGEAASADRASRGEARDPSARPRGAT